MDATAPPAAAPLPTDVPTLQAMVRELLARNQQLEARIAELTAKLDAALKHRFGRRSERRPAPPVPTTGKPPPRRDPHGRSPLPEHLERREVVHDLTEAQKLCPCCGRPRAHIGDQTAEQLDLEPARFFVLRTIKKSYACRHCDPTVPVEQRIVTAGPAQVGPIPKWLCGPGLLAHVVTAKFADHVPVHRLAGQLARSGVTIAASTLGDWLFRASDLLTPLYHLMHTRVCRAMFPLRASYSSGGSGGSSRTGWGRAVVAVGIVAAPGRDHEVTTQAEPPREAGSLDGGEFPVGRRESET